MICLSNDDLGGSSSTFKTAAGRCERGNSPVSLFVKFCCFFDSTLMLKDVFCALSCMQPRSHTTNFALQHSVMLVYHTLCTRCFSCLFKRLWLKCVVFLLENNPIVLAGIIHSSLIASGQTESELNAEDRAPRRLCMKKHSLWKHAITNDPSTVTAICTWQILRLSNSQSC